MKIIGGLQGGDTITECRKKLSATGDIEKILTYWSDDAIVMIPGQPTIKGKEAIKKMLEAGKKNPGPKMTWDPPLSINLSQSGDLAYIIAENHITMNDSSGNSMTQDNKALLVSKKEPDGSWKEVVVIFNEYPSQNK